MPEKEMFTRKKYLVAGQIRYPLSSWIHDCSPKHVHRPTELKWGFRVLRRLYASKCAYILFKPRLWYTNRVKSTRFTMMTLNFEIRFVLHQIITTNNIVVSYKGLPFKSLFNSFSKINHGGRTLHDCRVHLLL